MPRPASPVRRVLADKNKNASIGLVNKHDKNPSALQVPSPKASKLYIMETNSTAILRQPMSPKIGQKRRIDQVEDAEREEEAEEEAEAEEADSPNTTDTTSLSQLSDPISNSDANMDAMLVDSGNDTTSTAQSTLPSFHASQADMGPAEVQFEIHEEMSQKTLESLHAVSLPHNNSLSFLRPSLLKDTSQISVSMSSLIDFDQTDSQPDPEIHSQQPETTEPSEEKKDEVDGTEDHTRKHLLDEKAATLRTRLQLAFYKLQTNQATTPFSRLAQSSKSASPPPQPYSSSPMSSPHLPTRTNYFNSPESRIAIARARATMQTKPAVKPLADIAMPDIRPTAYSARWQQLTDPALEAEQIPSSPPDSLSTNLRLSAMPRRINTPSPASKKHRQQAQQREQTHPQTPMQLSSPPGSPRRQGYGLDGTATSRVRGSRADASGLTSSVVKGEAANSLLQLTRAGSGLDEAVRLSAVGRGF